MRLASASDRQSAASVRASAKAAPSVKASGKSVKRTRTRPFRPVRTSPDIGSPSRASLVQIASVQSELPEHHVQHPGADFLAQILQRCLAAPEVERWRLSGIFLSD